MCIEKIELPLNFDVKNINCYVIKEDPITIIDPGIYSKKFINFLKEKLNKIKLNFSDIKRILLTHGHTDHAGIAGFLQEKYGCEIFINKNDYEKITLDIQEKIELKRETFGKFLEKEKFPKEIIDFLIQYVTEFYKFSYKAKEIKFLNDGDIIEFEKFTLKVIFLPGHTSGHCGFIYNENFFSGDVLLKDIFVTPILEFEKDGSSKRNLENFLKSLEKIKDFIELKWLTGHDDGNFNKLNRIEELKNFLNSWMRKIKNSYNFLLTGYENFIKLFSQINKEKLLFYISLYFGILEILKKNIDKK